MIRKQLLLSMPHPDYSVCEFWYTLKLQHGGMTIEDSGMIDYIDDTETAFDFIDSRLWSLRYLDGLCQQLGYLGTKRYYVKDDSDNLTVLEKEHDFLKFIQGARETRELTVFLDATKSVDVSGGEPDGLEVQKGKEKKEVQIKGKKENRGVRR